MDSFDVVTVGNAKVDILLQILDSNKHFRLDYKTGELSIKSGDKITVDNAFFLIGGNAANVSIGLSRAGFKSAILAEIGSDEFSDKIINTLNNERVSQKFLKKTQSASSFSVIINYKGDRTIFEEHVQREHNFSFEEISTKWIYLTSMGDKWQGVYKKILEYVLQKGVKLAFNPGAKQLEDINDFINQAIKASEIIFLNKEEASKICGFEPSNEESLIGHLLSEIKNKGAKIVVITDGEKGAHMIDDTGMVYYQEPEGAQVVERTGAGDGFASGFLSAVLKDMDYQTAIEWGSRNAAAVIGKIGATSGLLRLDSLDKKSVEVHDLQTSSL